MLAYSQPKLGLPALCFITCRAEREAREKLEKERAEKERIEKEKERRQLIERQERARVLKESAQLAQDAVNQHFHESIRRVSNGLLRLPLSLYPVCTKGNKAQRGALTQNLHYKCLC